MSETKWTPGPWEAVKEDYPETGDVVKGMGSVEGEIFTICQMCDFDEPELSANRNLAAAAPELYEALDKTDEIMEALLVFYAMDQYEQRSIDWAQSILKRGALASVSERRIANRLALAKARGEQP